MRTVWGLTYAFHKLFVLAVALLLGGAPRAGAQEAICAEVKIVIQQRVSLERQAFEAVLRINNGLDGISVEDIQVNLLFKDADGNSVNSEPLFFVAAPEWSGVVNGAVPPRSSGSGTWLIIPRASAGGDLPAGRRYLVGATVDYRLGEESKSVEVIPETITVLPQPLLQLDYFLPFDVYGDDPFTPDIEPSQPFTLGVRIKNVGHGEARNLTIETSQPEIVENVQGLLVDFQILGGYVDDQVASPSLLLDFGTIAPQAARVGRWQMTASLNGQFRDMNTTYTHADTLGGALTSLIAGEIPSHRLVKDVLVDLPGRDGVRDFLAIRHFENQEVGFLHVFESEGSDCQADPGTSCVTQIMSGELSLQSGGVYEVSFGDSTPPAGTYFYGKIRIPNDNPGPFQHEPALVVQRADGSSLPASNAWISKERDKATEPWQYYFNLFDVNAQVTYTVTPGEVGPLSSEIQGRVVVDDGFTDPYGLLNVNIRLQGAGDSGVDLLLVTNSEGRYRFGDLPAGTYALTVADLTEYQDGGHQAGSAGGQVVGASIAGIHLEAGTVATDYVFVKQPVSSERQADLALSLTPPTGSVVVDEPFELRLGLVNSGPEAAQSVLVDLTWPAAFIVEEASGAGSFDAATRKWVLDGLVNGGLAELVLTVRTQEAGVHGVSAFARHVGTPPLGDPDAKNNTASALVEVEPASELRLDVGPVREARVLALIGCVGTVETLSCLSQRQIDAETLLAALPVADYLATFDYPEFLSELRSGYWNVVWLSSSADHHELAPALVDELLSLMLAGDSVLVEGDLMAMPEELADLLGAQFGYEGFLEEERVIVEGDALPSAQYFVTGHASPFHASGSLRLAFFPSRHTAIAERMLGLGRAVTTAFSLTDVTDPNDRLLLARALFDRLTPEPSTEIPAGGHLTAGASISNGESAGGYRLLMQAAPDHQFIEARPAASTLLPLSVEWVGDFLSGATLDRAAILAVPPAPGSSTIDITLLQVPAGQERVGSIDFTILDYDGYLGRARTAIAAMQLSGAQDLLAQQMALSGIDAAILLAAPGKYDLAYDEVIGAIGFVRTISAEETSGPASDLGRAARRLMRVFHERAMSIKESSPHCQDDGAAIGEEVGAVAESGSDPDSLEGQGTRCGPAP